jgi:hypothetical protein
VTDIKPVENTLDTDLIEHIEQLLEMAKAGEVVGMAEVTLYTGRNLGNGWCAKNSDDSMLLLAEVVRLQLELMLANRGFRDEIKERLDI